MPIDPQLEQILAAVPMPDFGGGTDAVTVRADYDAVAALRPIDIELAEVHDERVPGGDGRPDVPVRIYRPQLDATLPLVVFAHGGGFVVGSVATHDRLARRLARDTGAVVVSVDYRLAPEHPYPAAVEDCGTALRWAVGQAERLGIDPARVAVAGDSAGATLAAVITQEARAAGWPALAFQLLIYPATDGTREFPSTVENAEAPVLTRRAMAWFSEQYIAGVDESVLAADPARHAPLRAADLSNLPPALVATAGYDPLRDDGEAYAAALQAAGVPVVVRRFPELVHGFASFDGISTACTAAVDNCVAALRAGLQAREVPASDGAVTA